MTEKIDILNKNIRRKQARKLATSVGSLVEDRIGEFLEQREVAPVLPGFEGFAGEEGGPRPDLSDEMKRLYESTPRMIPQDHLWYRFPLPDGISGDGSEFHMYVKKGTCRKLVIFLSGGGAAWNEFTAARPVTGAAVAAKEPNYYWNNLRPFTQIMNISMGITEANNPLNPFNDWNFAVIPYTTADFHVGNGELPYTDLEGNPQVLYFHGRENARLALEQTKRFFPEADQILLAGDSAGAFGVPATASLVSDDFYPDCQDITLFSDSAQVISLHWREIVRGVWKAPEPIWNALGSNNLAYDWYRELLSSHPGRFRCLYASSTHDYLLSTFYNDINHKEFVDDAASRNVYFKQLKNMCRGLRELDPNFAFFINDWSNKIYTRAQAGTVHTAVRQLYFYFPNRLRLPDRPLHIPGRKPSEVQGRHDKNGITMARWLDDAVKGDMYNVGMKLLER